MTDPVEPRKKITLNAIKCAHCGTLVVSTYRHHYHIHRCPGLGTRWIAADGGTDYLRRCYDVREDWVEASEWKP